MINRLVHGFFGLIFLVVLSSHGLYAQQEWEETGEIEDAEVVIEKDRKIELPAANRTYQKVPPKASEEPSGDLEYNFSSHQFNGASFMPSIQPKRLAGNSTPVPGYGYAKLGFGNYVSPLAELSAHAVNQSLSAGIDFRHLSFGRGPVDGKNSASSDNDARLYLRSASKNNTTQLNLNFGTMKRFHYGFSEGSRDEIDPTEQRYNQFGANLTFKNNNEESLIDYQLDAGFYTLDDRFNAGESGFTGDIKLSSPITDQLRVFTDIDVFLSTYKEVVDIKRNLGRLKGGIVYDMGSLQVTAAANLTLNNDTISNANDFKVYPHVRADYQLTNQWTVSAGVLGDLSTVNLKQVVKENPFIAQNVALNHSNKQIEIFGEIKGRLSDRFEAQAGVSFSDYENLYFYTDTLRFDLSYDDDTKVLNLFAELNYNDSEQLSINSRFDYYYYSMGILTEAWHRPTFSSTISARYPVNNKINTGMMFSLLSGIKAFDPQSAEAVNLDAIFDLGVDVQYGINDKIRAFLELDNLLGQKYERFINYPNRSVMVHLGAIYSF